MVSFDELLAQGTIARFPATEKEKRRLYLEFHEHAHQEDLAIAQLLKERSHRWSVTTAYYAMLNATKLYLAKHHNLAITERSHFATRIALEHVLRDDRVRRRALELLAKAEREFESFTLPNKSVATLPLLLNAAREKREKASYYADPQPQRRPQDLDSFFKSIVEPFLAILKELG